VAKKRVHEIAKAKGIESKELIAALKKAGVDVKTASSSVDEAAALKALDGGGAAPATKPATKSKAPPAPAKPAPRPIQASKGPVRPAEKPTGGGGGSGAGSKKRRVVIDSQAARRDQMGGPPPQRPPRRRGGRRRRPLL